MKLLHIMLGNFFIDNYSYQENLLTKYHKKLGYDVEVIASLFNFDENGEGYYESRHREYINENKIPVTRLEFKNGPWNKRLRKYKGTYKAIEKAEPDIIFIHGCQFTDIKEVVKYLEKNPQTKVYVDNHADFSNSATNWLSKNILHKRIWRKAAQLIDPYTEKFYGVLPARVDFLNKIYQIPRNKIELLVMGADDEKVERYSKSTVRESVRQNFDITPKDFLIVTGGKIDLFKLEVLNLMNVVANLKHDNIKLIVYGSVVPELKEKIQKLSKNKSIKYIGWIDNDQSYELFSAADLLIFPGRHSVYWEQAVAMGKPIVAKYWEGTTHVDLGGNSIFLYENTETEMERVINELVTNDEVYKEMLKKAQKQNKRKFLYSEIAKSSIEI